VFGEGEGAASGRGVAPFFLSATGLVWFGLVWFGLVVLDFALASALCLRASSVAPVRGGTYFSLPPQRKVGKRKRLTPPALMFA
jgi:hypothetical protein